MIKGACHCGAVGFELLKEPAWLTACNCSVCRRLGALWAYAEPGEVRLRVERGATSAYVWGDKTLAFHHCRICGCTTHWESLQWGKAGRMALNCRLADPADIESVRIRRFDGSDSWQYLD